MDVVKPVGASEGVEDPAGDSTEDSEEEEIKANREEVEQGRLRKMGGLVEDADNRMTKDSAERTGKHAMPVAR